MEEYNSDKIKNYHMEYLLIFIFIVSIFFILLLVSYCCRATDVSGYLSSDTTWNVSGSPYVVKGDIIVEEDVNLTIDPGVKIEIDGYYKIYVDGNFLALGNATDNITFTPLKYDPTTSSWRGIQINSTGYANLNYCNISHAFDGIYLSEVTSTTIANSSILGGHYGIQPSYSSNISVINSYLLNNHYGISHYHSSNISIESSIILGSRYGISFSYSKDCRVIECNISKINQLGLGIYHSSRIKIHSTEIWDNEFRYVNLKLSSKNQYDHQFINCTINGKPIYYYNNENNITIEHLKAGALLIAVSEYVMVRNCNVTDGDGIQLYYTTYSKLQDCNISGNEEGIFICNSKYNLIYKNNIEYNHDGIWLDNSRYNNITDNEIFSNQNGLYITYSKDNWIYHNNFIENENQVNTYYSSFDYNYWDNGQEGNYWSDHRSKDDGGDGIRDEPYHIFSNNYDNYPLWAPWKGCLPPDTKPPRITRSSVQYGRPMILPRDGWRLEFTANEQVHYEVIIDSDGTQGFDNSTDTVLRSQTISLSHTIFWNGSDLEGDYVEDGEYQIQVMIWDRAGNPMNAPEEYSVSTIRDLDLDGVYDVEDAFPHDPTESEDFDGDGIGDNSDPDWDNDKVRNSKDAFPWDSNEWADSDNDGIGDNADPDDNNNGIPDIVEIPIVIVIFLIPVLTLYLTNRYVKGKKEGEE